MLSKVLTANGKYTNAHFVAKNERLTFEAKSVGPQGTAKVTNGTFTSNITGWTGQNGTANVYGTIVAASNLMRLTQPAAAPLFCNAYQSIVVVPGASYDYSLDVAATDVPAVGNAFFAIGTTVPVAGAVYVGDVLAAVSIGSAATYTGTFALKETFANKESMSETVYIVFQNNGAVNDVLDIDNVTISGGNLSAILSVLWILGDNDGHAPRSDDPRWALTDKFSIAGTDAHVDVSKAGGAWFMIGIVAAGDYTNGNVQVKTDTCRDD